MSSAKDVEPDAPIGHDERLSRAFDRAARLGIDIGPDGPDDPITERAAAAVRAFTALNIDATDDDPQPDAGPASTGDPRPAPPATPGIDPAETGGPGAAVPLGDRGAPADTGPGTTARPSTVLRPDAVLRGRPVPLDDRGATVRQPGETEVDVPRTATRASWGTAAADDGAPLDPAVDRRTPARGDATGATAAPGPLPGGRFLLDLLAAAIAAGAFVSPWAWMVVVAAGVLAATAAWSLADHGAGAGALLRRAFRRIGAWLRPRAVVRCGLVLVQAGLLAVVLPGLVCAVWWIADQGVDGAFVAGRLGVWAHSFRVAAAALCFLLVAGVGDAHHRRADRLARLAGQAGPVPVGALAVAAVFVAAGVVALVPRADAGPLAADDGLGWAPARLRDNLDRLRDDVVTAELHAADGCLSDRQGLTWRTSHTAGNPPGARDTATIRASGGTPTPSQIATAVAALHNQLAPWVEGIEVWSGYVRLVVLDRASLPSGRPLVDAAALERGATEGHALLAGAPGGIERATALACAAAPLP